MTVQHVARAKPGGTSRVSFEESRTHADEAFAYFTKIRARLFKKPEYRGKFIAIRDRKIVGVGKDKFALYEDVVKRFPDQKFIVSQVLNELPSASIDSL
jgi:hypothetical protein